LSGPPEYSCGDGSRSVFVDFVSRPPDPHQGTLPAEAAQLIAALQSELAGMKAEMGAKVSSLEETLANLAQDNMLLKWRLYGNKTERSRTSEAQLVLGDLLAAESQLQKELDAAVAQAAKDAGAEPNGPASPVARSKSKGRRDLFASGLPRSLVEILDEELEAKGCRRIGFEASKQLMFRRVGGRSAPCERSSSGAKPGCSMGATHTPKPPQRPSASSPPAASSVCVRRTPSLTAVGLGATWWGDGRRASRGMRA
jgi:hypothetical protein